MKRLLKTIFKYKLSSGLTLLSLIVAFLGIIILTLYVSYERSFDNFHKNGKNVYQLSFKEMGGWVAAPLRELIQNQVPEVEHSVVFSEWWDNMVVKDGGKIKDAVKTDCLAASTDFFTMFNFPLVQGNAKDVLSQPNTVVISQSLANKMFNKENAVGQTLQFYSKRLKVSGIMKDMPQNTSFRSDAIIAFETYLKDPKDSRGAQQSTEWGFHIFLQLKPNVNKALVSNKISNIKEIKEVLDYMKKGNPNAGVVMLQPLKDLHFTANNFFAFVNKKVLNVLIFLAIMLTIMGAVNFINFSTSQAPLRAKSLSVQQILGEKKQRARLQIIAESVILALVALITALFIHSLTYPSIQNLFLIKGLSFSGRYMYILFFVGFAVLFGILAGFYPSRYITSPPVAQAVKGKMFFSGKGRWVRSTLMTVQFVFAIGLIAAALTIEKQLNFWSHFDIGIKKENVIYLGTSSPIREHYQAFADELMKNKDISDYTYAQFYPGMVGMGWGREVDGQQVNVTCWPVDERFLDFYGVKIKQGRKFYNGKSDINNFIINEKAVQQFKWEKPLEKKFPGFDFTGNIVGVAQNFNFSSLKGEVTPMVFWLTDTRKQVLMLRAKTENYTQLMKFIKTTALKFDPDWDGEPKFLDDALNKLYDKETKIARFIEFVALWTVLLALTGLLGLIVFITRDKVKEIGVRKVNGAKVLEIIQMLNKSVVIWLSIAFVIATPIAYYAMNKWLQTFAYKTTLSWWVFALAGVLALAIALLTVSWQSWRAATRNPVEALRYE